MTVIFVQNLLRARMDGQPSDLQGSWLALQPKIKGVIQTTQNAVKFDRYRYIGIGQLDIGIGILVSVLV